MKRRIVFSLTLLLSIAACAAVASPKNDPTTNDHVVQVLVHVNAKGEVTNVAPAYQLRPSFVRQIRSALQEMITDPAVKDGRPSSSQLVVTLGLTPTVDKDGGNGVKITYISSKALPTGSWYWESSSQHRLTLVGQPALSYSPTMHTMVEQREGSE